MVFKKSCGSQGGIHQPPSFSSHHHPSSPSSFPLENLSAGSQNTLKTSLPVSSVLKSTPKQSCHLLHCLASSVRVIGPGTGLLLINNKKQKCLPALSCPSPKPILLPKDNLCHSRKHTLPHVSPTCDTDDDGDGDGDKHTPLRVSPCSKHSTYIVSFYLHNS